MELPAFDMLWATSNKLDELEQALQELDQCKMFKKSNSFKRVRKGRGLYGTQFNIENNQYYQPVKECCDEEFYTEDEYKRHLESHVKCSVESCPFVAHTKAMKLHNEVVHGKGYFDAIYCDSSDRTVSTWRDARKRNYPTLERVQVQNELIKNRIERGQIFEINKSRFKNRKSSVVNTVHMPQSPTLETLQPVQSQEMSSNHQPSPFSLVSVDYGSDTNSADELNRNTGRPHSNAQTKADCQEEEEIWPEKSISVRKRRRRGRKSKPNQDTTDIDDTTNMKTDQHGDDDKPSKNPFSSHLLVQLQKKRKKCLTDINRIHSRPTLLQMLLSEDICRERNQLMQCIRFVVNNNFFLDQSS